MKAAVRTVMGRAYRSLLKPVFFSMDPEYVHERMVQTGAFLGNNGVTRKLLHTLFAVSDTRLKQTLHGIQFGNPTGLSAGFDYEAQLTQILPSVGFGFMTVGTITNKPYEGNPKPRLGRLPKSRSLMVNKGFKNPGADRIIRALTGVHFQIPVGVSIGRTNTRTHCTVQQSIEDVVQGFEKFEKSPLEHAYYELNISCPNLYGDVSFYPPENLKTLLKEIDRLGLSRPIFVKMPIEKNNAEVKQMLRVIADYSPVGVIFGNLQKDRSHQSLVQSEVKKFSTGNFSGKPTYDRSNELISLAYTEYTNRFTIIGCGGVFSAGDAYQKIIRGASLVQLITGMIFEGPQLIGSIHDGLLEILKNDGFSHISEAVGTHHRVQ